MRAGDGPAVAGAFYSIQKLPQEEILSGSAVPSMRRSLR